MNLDDAGLPRLDAVPLPVRDGDWQAVRARAAGRQRRRLLAASAAVVLAAVVPVAVVGAVRDARPAELADAAPDGIAGLVVVEGASLGREHLTGPVDYDRSPPLGGDHAPAPQECGIYAEPVPDGRAVHSLEHGAVWLTYRPGLPVTAVETLQRVVGAAGAYGLLSPHPEQSAPVVATAWGRQLSVESADDPRLVRFVELFTEGPQTPEPGARCSGEDGFVLAPDAGPTGCTGDVQAFDILISGTVQDGPTVAAAAAAYAARRGNGASFAVPPGPWEVLVQTAGTARARSGPVVLVLLPVRDGWAVTGGRRCLG